MLSMVSLSSGFVAPAVPVVPNARATSVRMETLDDLKAMAVKLNPAIGYFNPTSLAEMEFWGTSQEATIGFLRQAEIKHGRVAMAAFVGYIVQANGICFPFGIDGTTSFADISAAGGPADQFDALSTIAKLQIVGAIGLLEVWSESNWAQEAAGNKHYMSGGKPGVMPSFQPLRDTIGHPPLDLFDPFGFSKNKSPEAKEKGLLVEINNGRLAMLGIFGFVAESKVAGSVPALNGLIKPYAGEPMAFFSASDKLPYVEDMLKFHF